MSILDSVRKDIDAAKNASTAGNGTTTRTDRTPTQFWLNVGLTLKGAGEDGEDLFVSLPLGIPLDDIKPANVKGTNQNYIHLLQAKNALLNATQAAAAKLEPGERQMMPEFSVELARVAAPEQQGTVSGNPLLASLMSQLGG